MARNTIWVTKDADGGVVVFPLEPELYNGEFQPGSHDHCWGYRPHVNEVLERMTRSLGLRPGQKREFHLVAVNPKGGDAP